MPRSEELHNAITRGNRQTFDMTAEVKSDLGHLTDALWILKWIENGSGDEKNSGWHTL